jgi:ABC-2 type transport system permease protein
MIGTILRFELAQRMRRISTYVYFAVFFALGFLFILATGGAIAGATVDFGTGGKVLANSPYALNLIISYCCLFGLMISAAIAGQATYQDVESNCTQFFYTAPITKFEYLGGRFLGSFATQCIIFSSVGLGVWFGAHTPWLDHSRLGADRMAAYLQPYLISVFPNLFLTSAIFFALSALTRKMLPVYVGSVLLLFGYFVATQFSSGFEVKTITALADPFGGVAVDRFTRYWTPFERNMRLIPAAGIVLANRVLWLSMGVICFGFAYARLSFSHVDVKGKPDKTEDSIPFTQTMPVVRPTFSATASWMQFGSLTLLQFKETVKNIFFIVLVFAGWLFAVFTALGVTEPYRNPMYPVTSRMLDFAGGGFSVFALAIITFVAGELVWRERDARISQITDATPVHGWILFSSKLCALMLVQIMLVLVILTSGLTVQIMKGFHHFKFGLYFRYLFGVRLITFWLLCVLAMLVHTLVNQKYLGHFVMALHYVAMIAMPALGFEHLLFRFGRVPDFVYSDMNGFGPFLKPIFFFQLYWVAASVLLVLLTNLLWVRGVEGNWRLRLRLAARNFSPGIRIAGVCAALLFVALGSYIFYNTNILNRYRNKFQVDEERAQYEKKYRSYSSLPQPRIIDVNVQVDLDPEHRVVALKGAMVLENKTAVALDEVALTIWPVDLQPIPRPHIQIKQLNFSRGQAMILGDDALGFRLYRLAKPLQPHDQVQLNFSLIYENPGFVNSRPNTDIVDNGSFLNSSYYPYVGYETEIELTDDSTRHRHGLQTVKRLPKLEDAAARSNSAIASDADWIKFEGTVSTRADQIALMPGYLEREWTQNGRHYFHYKMDSPILPIVSLNSARYAVMHDHWRNVNLEIYYHPGHEFDLERMMKSMKATLDYCAQAYSPYQYRQLRIVEFPGYGTFAESFPNTIPFSESIGFITYVDPKKPDTLDLPFFVTAHEVAHQWWAHQVVSANSEGATAIVETLAQYTAFMVMKKTYGPESMRKFLRFELDQYLRGRGTERNEEKPLCRVEPDQGYIHYNKGGLVMYALQDYVGESAVNRALSEFTKAYAFKGAPYPTSLDLIAYLKEVTPPEFQYLYDDLFEHITIYDNRALSATCWKRSDGRYQVHLVVKAGKYRADGHGQEHTVPIDDWMDIGVLNAEGKYLYLQKHRIDRENLEFDLALDQRPAEAGIDPLIKLIDRNPDDNLVKVGTQ